MADTDPDAPVVLTMPGTGMPYRLADDGCWYVLGIPDHAIALAPAEVAQLVPCAGPTEGDLGNPDRWLRRKYDKDDRGLWHLETGIPRVGVTWCGGQVLGHYEVTTGDLRPLFDGDQARPCPSCLVAREGSR